MLETNEFLSYQPYLELNNNYQSYVPIEHNIIRDIVWEVYEVDDFDLGKTVALPDVCADIMTFYTDDNAYSFFMGGSISLQQMNELDFMKDVKSIFGVRLRTGMLGNLFRCDGQNIVEDSLTKQIVYMPPEAKDIKALINQMIKEFDNKTSKDIPIPIKAGIIEYEFVTIHPFWDGNGRTSRLLANYILKAYGYDLKGFYVME